MDLLQQFKKFSWCKPEWSLTTATSKQLEELRKHCNVITDHNDCDVEEIIEKSKRFPIPFPIQSVRMYKLKETVPLQTLNRNAASTYPIIHEKIVLLMVEFLKLKREYGSSIEKSLYKDMTVPVFIDRILKKRAITFMGPQDKYKLITGEESKEGWELVGTLQQKPPLTLDRVLSYDEMKISSMVYVSSRTHFINNGARQNNGVPQDKGVETDGVIIGLIGPRLKRKNRMEYEDMMITPQQNVADNGFQDTTTLAINTSFKQQWRQLWSKFYEVDTPTYEALTSKIKMADKPVDKDKYTDRYVKIFATKKDIFDNEVYYKRLCVTFDCALLEANERASLDDKMAYLYIVGIGLGVWKASTHQIDAFVLTLLERIQSILCKGLINHVTDVNIAYVKPNDDVLALFTQTASDLGTSANLFLKSEKHPKGGIKVSMSNREPSSELPSQHRGKLLVVTYPWDGNAHPGNEFWINKLSSSGDPAAACSSQVSELHNAHINTALTHARTRVPSAHGIGTIQLYCKA